MKRVIIGVMLVVSVLLAASACGSPAEYDALYNQSGDSKTQTATLYSTSTMTATKAPTVDSDEGIPGSSQERLIIRTGYMTLVVEDVPGVLETITQLANSYDGFVVSSNSWRDGDRMMGTINIRVVADRFYDAIAQLRGLAVEVRSESTSGQDVTEEYVDLEASLKNLEASEQQLLTLMEQAGTVKEILDVQRELTSTRGQIEQTKGLMQYLEQSASLSLIQVNLEQSKLVVLFTASKRNVKEGEKISFQADPSGGFAPYGYQWDFGDGNTSTIESPVHTYEQDGTFTVTLQLTDDRGNDAEEQRADYITVNPGWSAGNIASGAWNGLVGFFRAMGSLFIWLGIFSPVWLIIIAIVYFIVRSQKKKRNS